MMMLSLGEELRVGAQRPQMKMPPHSFVFQFNREQNGIVFYRNQSLSSRRPLNLEIINYTVATSDPIDKYSNHSFYKSRLKQTHASRSKCHRGRISIREYIEELLRNAGYGWTINFIDESWEGL